MLDLGQIYLNQRGTTTYRILNLPKADFVAGIEISVAMEDRTTIEKHAVSPAILLELTGEGGKVLFTKKSTLDIWTWSIKLNDYRAFIYGSGESGTYFRSFPKTEYTLRLTVLQPDTSGSEYAASLVAKSSGWK
jgi:hypothetical protein